jgi:hypothetical protein
VTLHGGTRLRVSRARESTGPSSRRWRIALLLGALGLVMALAAIAQADSEAIFSEKMIVTERTVWVDDEALPRMDSAFRRKRSDFLVRIDGAPAELVLSAAEDPPQVTHLVWLDPDLASHAALAAAATQLASALQSFPESESFSLVEVDGQAPPLQESLSRLELVLRLQRFAARPAPKSPASQAVPTLERRIAALNRLAVRASRYSSGDLGALWLAAEAWAVDPAVFEEILRTGAEEMHAATPLGALQRSSRILASYGWVLFPVCPKLLGPGVELKISARDDQSREFLERGLGPSPRYDRPNLGARIMVYLFGAGERHLSSKQSLHLSRALDLATEIRLAPMAMVARATSGALAGDPSRIAELASRLRSRRPLVVRDTTTIGAELRQLEVVWVGGDGRTVPALPWAASLTPPELGISRLLSAVESADSQVGAPLHLRPETAGSESALCFTFRRERTAIRLLWWSAADRRVEVGKPVELTADGETPETPDAGEPGDACVPLPAGIEPTDFVQLESLDSLEWGAARLSALSVSPLDRHDGL